MMRSLLTLFDQYVKLNRKVPPEILTSLSGIDEPGRLADTIAAHMVLKLDEKQRILEIEDVSARLEHLMGIIEGEIENAVAAIIEVTGPAPFLRSIERT